MKKKNISLVTWIGTGNYGTALQSFALHRYLADQGYEMSIVVGSPFKTGVRHIVKVIAYKLGLLNLLTAYRKLKYTQKEKTFDRFVSENYNIPSLITSSEIKNYYQKVDVLLSGSDQIWNTYYLFDEFMFLGFDVDKRRVAYASSIGTNSIKAEFQDRTRELLLKYDYIGVREHEAVNVLSDLTGRKDIVQVLDPTFLLSSDMWSKIAEKAQLEDETGEKYILCYLIGNNDWYREQVEHVKAEYGIDNVIIVPSEEYPDFNLPGAKVFRNAGPLEFVRLIKNSCLVCTDSFHATALSINLQRNFVEFVRFKSSDVKSQNSRIYDLLSHYNLNERLYDALESLWTRDIDYDPVMNVLEDDREKSRRYLEKALR